MITATDNETDLAWSLADQYRPVLSDHDRCNVYVNLGAGDSVRAIRCTLEALAHNHTHLSSWDAIQLQDWMRRYDRVRDFGALVSWAAGRPAAADATAYGRTGARATPTQRTATSAGRIHDVAS